MAKKIKYHYNTETCNYEKIKVSKRSILKHTVLFVTLTFLFSLGVVSFYINRLPQFVTQKKEYQKLLTYYELLEKEFENISSMLDELQERDDNIYRTIFEAEPIPSSVREVGVGGTEKYKELLEENIQDEELVRNMLETVDKIKRKMYVQTKSYDELLKTAKNKENMLASIPAIQPIANKQLTRLASGYGMRMHPILKIRKMHQGIDFSAPIGTPIYATGNGKIKKAGYSGTFGNMVSINHGYGYLTKYAHMSKINVRKGQKVKRGDIIGYVGNTGRSVGPHCHYEVHKDSKPVNPVYHFFNDVTDEEFDKLLDLASKENQSMGGGE